MGDFGLAYAVLGLFLLAIGLISIFFMPQNPTFWVFQASFISLSFFISFSCRNCLEAVF
jgi:hypothetical protein